MRLSDNMYTFLKWLTLVVIPAFTTAYVGFAAIWGWPYSTEIAKSSAVVCTLLGALLGISTAEYNRDIVYEEDKPDEDEDDLYPDEEDDDE